MSASKPDDYVLGRGAAESVRLDAQHLLWRMHLQYLLHPSIPVTDSLEIAELGCGTGMWLLDLLDELPTSVKLHGLDISDRQFPPRQFWPENVSFSVLDSLEEPPASLHGRFDVVHLRMWANNLTPATLPTVVSNIHKMLKPGGYLQWEEADIMNPRIQGEEARELDKNLNHLHDMVGLDYSWLDNLPSALENGSFNDVIVNKDVFRPALVQLGTNTYLLAVLEKLRGILARVDYRTEGRGFDFDGTLTKLLKEHGSGMVYNWGPTAVIAKKGST